MYYLIFGFVYLVSLLPFFVLYGISDFFFVIIYYIIRYRRSVVVENIRFAFPEKTEKEVHKIERQFYRNFMDNWIETIKLLSISRKALMKRTAGDYEVYDRYFKEGRSVQANVAHFFNWEILNAYCPMRAPYTFLTVYLPQASSIMNRLLKHIRSRWGNPQLPATEMARAMIPWRKKQHAMGLNSDQRPAIPENGYWLSFMNRPASFLKGTEKLARIQNTPVVLVTTTKPRRGRYRFDFFLLTEDPKSLKPGELMVRYVRHVEENIRKEPALYLWSHKRWKHQWKPEYKDLWVDDKPCPS